jgi:hypothetical protein
MLVIACMCIVSERAPLEGGSYGLQCGERERAAQRWKLRTFTIRRNKLEDEQRQTFRDSLDEKTSMHCLLDLCSRVLYLDCRH